MHKRRQPVAPQNGYEQLQQVQRLGIGHDAHSQQNGVCGKEAAYGGEGEVAVPVNILASYHLKSIFTFLFLTGHTKYNRKIMGSKGQHGQKKKERAGNVLTSGGFVIK